MEPYSRSWRQARMMLEQSAENLPHGVPRRVDARSASTLVANDRAIGHWYLPDGSLAAEGAKEAKVPPGLLEAWLQKLTRDKQRA